MFEPCTYQLIKAECGMWSGSSLFCINIGISVKQTEIEKQTRHPLNDEWMLPVCQDSEVK